MANMDVERAMVVYGSGMDEVMEQDGVAEVVDPEPHHRVARMDELLDEP